MFQEYCPKCNEIADKDELELREAGWYGDYEWFHMTCNTQTTSILGGLLNVNS